MLIKNKYKYKPELEKLRADLELVRLSKNSKERTQAMIKLNAQIMRQENINNKKKTVERVGLNIKELNR